MKPLENYKALIKVRNLRVALGMPLSYGDSYRVSFINLKWIATKK